MENRHGLVVDATPTHATGTAEREATQTMLDRPKSRHRITLGADKAYDVEAFVGDLRARRVTPHIAINGAVSRTGRPRKTAIDGRTTRHPRPRDQPALPQAHRGGLRLDQDPGRAGQGQGPVTAQGRGGLHLRGCRLQPRATPETPGRGGSMRESGDQVAAEPEGHGSQDAPTTARTERPSRPTIPPP